MANNVTTAKKATAKKIEEVKIFSFRGLVRSFVTVEDSDNRIVKFDTLNASKTKSIQFFALLTDSELYLAPYIKSKTVVEVQVKELPAKDGKRHFEIVSLMSELDRVNFDILLKDAEAQLAKA